MDEAATRPVPIGRHEIEWAHNRPGQHRVPVPRPGDQVMYRHDEWGDVSEAEVLSVQPLDDLDDPHLWFPQTDERGQLLELDGRPILAQKPDPWPRVVLRTRYGTAVTREARVRGSAGWLPLDWQTRYRPKPASVIAR